MTPSF